MGAVPRYGVKGTPQPTCKGTNIMSDPASDPAATAFRHWWSSASPEGDTARRPDPIGEAFAAGWQARTQDSGVECRLELTLFQARALRNQLRGISDPPAIVGTVLDALAEQISCADRFRA